VWILNFPTALLIPFQFGENRLGVTTNQQANKHLNKNQRINPQLSSFSIKHMSQSNNLVFRDTLFNLNKDFKARIH
jgi:hypothetical protein